MMPVRVRRAAGLVAVGFLSWLLVTANAREAGAHLTTPAHATVVTTGIPGCWLLIQHTIDGYSSEPEATTTAGTSSCHRNDRWVLAEAFGVFYGTDGNTSGWCGPGGGCAITDAFAAPGQPILLSRHWYCTVFCGPGSSVWDLSP
jgi:hypothetical protein